MAAEALEGIKVLEYGNFISAPFCGKLFADFGADVIKIEEPVVGDESRQYGPFVGDVPTPETSGLFMYLNTNKRGITLNLRTPTGQHIFKQLLKTTDIFIENNSKLMEEIGLDYAHLKKANKQLIVTSITPYGQTGSYKRRRGYAINCSALGGMSFTIGEPRRQPLTPPLSLGHYQSGIVAAIASTAALLWRKSTYRGYSVDVSEAETWATWHTGILMTSYIMHGLKRSRWGNRTPGFYPYTILPCKDGYVSMIAIQGYQWKKFLELIGNGHIPDWYSSDPRFQDRREMGQKYADELDALLAPWLMAHSKEEIFTLCQEKGIPFTPVRNMAEVVNSPHLEARGYFTEVGRKETGSFKIPGAPFKLSSTPWRIRRAAPLLGEHNEEIYGNLGYNRGGLCELRRTGII